MDESEDREPGLLMRLLGRGQPQAPPDPEPFGAARPSQRKPLTVPQDTVNALRLMAQDWVLEAREVEPRIRQVPGGYVKEYDTFGDSYTLEIERADDDDEATLLGYVFLDSTHFQTGAHLTEAAATGDTNFREQRRKLRMTFRLLERWEFSELAEEFVFNRVWELARIQFKPIVAAAPASGAPPLPEVAAPQATPRE